MAAIRQKVQVLREEVQLTLDFFAPSLDPLELPSSNVVPFQLLKPSPAVKSDSNKRSRGRPVARQEQIGNDFKWPKDIIVQMRICLLKATLAELANPLVKGREEKLSWLASNDISPFSFRVCCSAAGCDPDEFRNNLLDCIDDATWLHFDEL